MDFRPPPAEVAARRAPQHLVEAPPATGQGQHGATERSPKGGRQGHDPTNVRRPF
ncbi:hypothetical protein LY76DRAFT_651653 [Colletotrichum caudatum]|nr:hypothetical protein LY76DRAFT_651653 [Colletotrichum caudatum]